MPETIPTSLQIQTPTKRIAPAEGYALNLYGVREITWHETDGIAIHFVQGGSFKPIPLSRWLPVQHGGSHDD